MIRLSSQQRKALVGLTAPWATTDVSVAARTDAELGELGAILVRRESDQHAWIIQIDGNIRRLPMVGAAA